MDHRLGDKQSPLHAAGKRTRVSARLVLKMDGAEQLHRPPSRLWHAVETRLLVERLGRREEGIEQDLLRDDADRDLGVARMLVDVEAPDRGGRSEEHTSELQSLMRR